MKAAENIGKQRELGIRGSRDWADCAANMVKKVLMMGTTERFGEMGDQGRVMFTKEGMDTTVRMLNEVGVVATPGRPVVMTKKDGEFFASSNAAAGDNSSKGKMPE